MQRYGHCGRNGVPMEYHITVPSFNASYVCESVRCFGVIHFFSKIQRRFSKS
jgi:hypothetical protein